jgi:hypothetical protein
MPALIYVADYGRYAPALAAIRDLHEAIVVIGGEGPPLSGARTHPDLFRACARSGYFALSLRKSSTLAAVMLEGADPNRAVT